MNSIESIQPAELESPADADTPKQVYGTSAKASTPVTLGAAVSEPLPRSIAQVTAGWWRGRSQGVSGAAPYGRAGRLDPSSDGGAPRSSPCSGGWGRGEAGLSTRLAQPGSGATSAARLSRKRRSSSMAASGR